MRPDDVVNKTIIWSRELKMAPKTEEGGRQAVLGPVRKSLVYQWVMSAEPGNRTRTRVTPQRFLRPPRLPFRQPGTRILWAGVP
jgi:hypothetical protein